MPFQFRGELLHDLLFEFEDDDALEEIAVDDLLDIDAVPRDFLFEVSGDDGFLSVGDIGSALAHLEGAGEPGAKPQPTEFFGEWESFGILGGVLADTEEIVLVGARLQLTDETRIIDRNGSVGSADDPVVFEKGASSWRGRPFCVSPGWLGGTPFSFVGIQKKSAEFPSLLHST